MAIARCEKCGVPSQHVKPPGYSSAPFKPASYPNSGVVCGKPDCENVALIWLKVDEAAEYQRGRRVFNLPTQAAKIRLE